jgi:hypothetical protein
VVTEIPSAFVRGSANMVVPQDDEHSWWFYATPAPLGDEKPNLTDDRLTPGDASPEETGGFLPGSLRRARNKDNDYLLDRQMQRTVNYTGLPGNRVQDAMATESMGPIYDRSQEHLGTTDVAIIFWRRQMMRLARELEQGVEPQLLRHPEWFRVRPIDTVSSEPDFQALWANREHLAPRD